MRRGDIFVGAQRGEFTGKPRPYVIAQRDATLNESPTVTACPITTVLLGEGQLRIGLPPDASTGLEDYTEVEVDRVTTLRKDGVRKVEGVVSPERVDAIARGLKLWLDL